VKAAECVTNEILVSNWRETEYRLNMCHASNGAHTGVQCLKMYRFLQYTLWLKIYNVLLHCHLKPDTVIHMPSSFHTYLLNLLHGAGYYLKSQLSLTLLKISYFLYGTRRFVTMVTKVRHWTLS